MINCMEWNGARTKWGYGIKVINYKNILTHRLAYEWANGPIPDGMFVCHHCDNPPCCNPGHLFLCTAKDNAADMVAKGRCYQLKRTHCPHGHSYNKQNTRILTRVDGRKQRSCKECDKLRQRKYRNDRSTQQVQLL